MNPFRLVHEGLDARGLVLRVEADPSFPRLRRLRYEGIAWEIVPTPAAAPSGPGPVAIEYRPAPTPEAP